VQPPPSPVWADFTLMMECTPEIGHFNSVPYAVRYGSVRYGTVRYGMLRYGMVRYGKVRFGMVWCNVVVWYGMV
jgi:hypothetical protein